MPATQIFTRPKPTGLNTDPTYEPFLATPKVTHTVYTKTAWSGAWVASPNLECVSAVWSEGHALSTATVQWRYGLIAQPGTSTFATVARLTPNRQWVKIVFAFTRGGVAKELRWYGVVDIDHDEMLTATPAGIQTITCYGMEKLLAEIPLQYSYFHWAPTDAYLRVADPLAFNEAGKPNKWKNHLAPLSESYYFGTDPNRFEFWNSDSIVKYTLERDAPYGWAGAGTGFTRKVKFALKDDAPAGVITPQHDRPTITRFGRTPLDILRQVYDSGRLLGFRVWIDPADDDTKSADGDPNTSTEVKIIPISFADATITTSLETLPANPDQIHLITDYDQSASIPTLQKIAVRRRDQTIYRSERVTSTWTPAGAIKKGWSATLETEYNAGASAAPGYGGLPLDQRRRLNDLARSADKFHDVFARYVIAPYWSGNINQGAATACFPDIPQYYAAEIPIVYGYDPAVRVEAHIPLKAGVDYSGTKIADKTYADADFPSSFPVTYMQAGQELPIQVWWRCPEYKTTQRYTTLEKNAEFGTALSNGVATVFDEWAHSYSGHVIADGSDRGFRLEITGIPQAYTSDYLGHADDPPRFVLQVNDGAGALPMWHASKQTLTTAGGYYCEGKYPADSALTQQDVTVREIVDVPGFYLDYVVAGTVVGIKTDDASLLTSTGGYLRDGRPELAVAAQLAHTWYSQDRRVLQLSTEIFDERITLGALITQLGDPAGTPITVNTVITQLEVSTTGDTHRLSWVTGTGELDPLRLIRA